MTEPVGISTEAARAPRARLSTKRQAIWDKSGGHCWYCGCPLPDKGWHADHVEPIERKLQYQFAKGLFTTDECDHPERDTEDNKVPTCASCNIQKGSLSVEEFRYKIEHFIISLNRDHTQYAVAKRYGLIQETGTRVVFWFEQSGEVTRGARDA